MATATETGTLEWAVDQLLKVLGDIHTGEREPLTEAEGDVLRAGIMHVSYGARAVETIDLCGALRPLFEELDVEAAERAGELIRLSRQVIGEIQRVTSRLEPTLQTAPAGEQLNGYQNMLLDLLDALETVTGATTAPMRVVVSTPN